MRITPIVVTRLSCSYPGRVVDILELEEVSLGGSERNPVRPVFVGIVRLNRVMLPTADVANFVCVCDGIIAAARAKKLVLRGGIGVHLASQA